jgi:hypothetical protein
MKKLSLSILLLSLLLSIVMVAAGCTTTQAPAATASLVALAEAKSTVASISKYGNLTLAIAPADFKSLGYEAGDVVTIKVGDYTCTAPVGTNYSDVDNGKVVVRIKDPEVQVAINMGNFAKASGAQVGSEITINLSNKSGYLKEYQIRQLKKTEVRADYASDEVFANFRAVKGGKIAANRLYRSSNPVLGDARAPFSAALAEKAGIKTVINLADSKESAAQHIAEAPYYKSLDDGGNVIMLDMGVSFTDPEFIAKLHDGLIFMTTHQGPYLVHCNEGKDRAGFVNALLAALCGASMDELKSDYMISYENYYGVKQGTEQYDMIAKTIPDMFADLNGGKQVSDSKLSKVATSYLIDKVGLTKGQVNTLKANLE